MAHLVLGMSRPNMEELKEEIEVDEEYVDVKDVLLPYCSAHLEGKFSAFLQNALLQRASLPLLLQ